MDRSELELSTGAVVNPSRFVGVLDAFMMTSQDACVVYAGYTPIVACSLRAGHQEFDGASVVTLTTRM